MMGKTIAAKNFLRTALVLAGVFALSLVMPFFVRAGEHTVRVYFKVDAENFDGNDPANKAAIARLDSLMSIIGFTELDTLRLEAFSSPDGRTATNLQLARRRAASLRNHLTTAFPELKGHVEMVAPEENWTVLRELVYEDRSFDPVSRVEVLTILDSDWSANRKKAELKALPYFRTVVDRYYGKLRYAQLTFYQYAPVPDLPVLDEIVLALDIPEINDAPLKLANELPFIAKIGEPAPAPAAEPEYIFIERPLFAVTTNALYDLALTPNFGYEIPIGNRFSFFSDYAFPWWVTRDNSRAWQMLKWDIGGRWYFSKHDKTDRFDILWGHYLGVDLGTGYYDLEPKHEGYQGEFQLYSLEYGYGWVLGRRWRLDATIGAGLFSSHYRYYKADSQDKHLSYQHHGKLYWTGPVKLGVTVKYLFTIKSRRKVA